MLLMLLLVVGLLVYVEADVYMHNMRGSNNRLNEQGVNRDNNNRMCDTQNNAKGGYAWGPKMYYYVGSHLTIEWTNQHGCGGNNQQKNVHCEVILQYMCGDEVRDGVVTQTIPDDETAYNQKVTDPEDPSNQVFKYGMHESYQYYQDCKARERNKGLFLADQRLGQNTARFTRQNPGGGRSGFECPEERDYYPYWHPTPWKDIAVLTSDVGRCDYYKSNSENKKGRGYCTIPKWNNMTACLAAGGQWLESSPYSNIPNVDCKEAPLTRDNHLGNTPQGYASTYNWTIPDDANENCVLRIRYNISTGDYDGWNTYAGNVSLSPVTQDPYVPFDFNTDFSTAQNLSLAIDTAQYGRTFQDRSYVFAIRQRPSGINSNEKIFNFNVRGKRGNIVQVYPAVEYDFVPVSLNVRPNDHIHFQWTGSDFNPQNYDGEGTAGTDRSNLVQIESLDKNYPLPLGHGNQFLSNDDAFLFAHLNQQNCLTLAQLIAKHGKDKNGIERDPQNCMKLNAASRYFDGGLIQVGPTQTGQFYFMSSRNNNFSNRSQKAMIVSIPFLPVWAIVLVCLAGVACLASVVLSGVGVYAKLHPNGRLARLWNKVH